MTDSMSCFLWTELVPTIETDIVCPTIIHQLLPFKDIIKTITFDNGRKFSRHPTVYAALATDCYFTHPYHSMGKDSVENTNGILRQYFKKVYSFVNLSQDNVRRVCNLINHCPRKKFGSRTSFGMALNICIII